MSRRHCQSEEVDWDMAGESCSEVKMPLAGGTAQVQLQSRRLAQSSRTPGWFGCSRAQRAPGKAGRICKPMINSVQSPSLLLQGSQGWGAAPVRNWAAAIGAAAGEGRAQSSLPVLKGTRGLQLMGNCF